MLSGLVIGQHAFADTEIGRRLGAAQADPVSPTIRRTRFPRCHISRSCVPVRCRFQVLITLPEHGWAKRSERSGAGVLPAGRRDNEDCNWLMASQAVAAADIERAIAALPTPFAAMRPKKISFG